MASTVTLREILVEYVLKRLQDVNQSRTGASVFELHECLYKPGEKPLHGENKALAKQFVDGLDEIRVQSCDTPDGVKIPIPKSGRPFREAVDEEGELASKRIFKRGVITFPRIVAFIEFTVKHMLVFLMTGNAKLACEAFEWLLHRISTHDYKAGRIVETIESWVQRNGGLPQFSGQVYEPSPAPLTNACEAAVADVQMHQLTALVGAAQTVQPLPATASVVYFRKTLAETELPPAEANLVDAPPAKRSKDAHRRTAGEVPCDARALAAPMEGEAGSSSRLVQAGTSQCTRLRAMLETGTKRPRQFSPKGEQEDSKGCSGKGGLSSGSSKSVTAKSIPGINFCVNCARPKENDDKCGYCG